MVGGGDPDWLQIRRAYDGFALSLSQICNHYGVTKPQITKRRLAEGWTPRPMRWRRREVPGAALSAPGRPPDTVPAAAQEPGRKALPKRRAASCSRRDMVRRLYRVIDKKLQNIEERMENGDGASPADTERDVRSISALIRNLEKLTEFDEQDSGGGDRKDADAGISADEADRIRRELKSRIDRLCGGQSG